MYSGLLLGIAIGAFATMMAWLLWLNGQMKRNATRQRDENRVRETEREAERNAELEIEMAWRAQAGR